MLENRERVLKELASENKALKSDMDKTKANLQEIQKLI